jgi:phosphatidylinositol glycan class B
MRASAPARWRGIDGRIALDLRRIGLRHLLLLALLLRLAAATVWTAVHPDEVFQYLETAHRLVFGPGIVTWEWRDGIRGWLLPMMVAVPMAIGGGIAPNSSLYLLLPNLLMIGVSLVTVVVAWRLGERISRLHALFTGFVAAIWCEFVYLGPHVTSETCSIALILPAALILIDRDGWSGRRLAFAASMLANAAAIRFQHLPAIAALVLICCARDVRSSWRPLLIGGLAGLLPSILCDLSMGSTPFAWIIENYRFNIVQNRAGAVTSSGPLGYLTEMWPHLALWSVPLAMLAAVGARRYPALAGVAVVNLVFHSAIAHKEYRYVLLSVVIAILLAALGTVDWVRLIARRQGAEAARRKLRFLAIVWLLASASLAAGSFRTQWTKFTPELDAFSRVREDPSVCGVAVYRHDFTITGGYAYLHRATPILYFTDDDAGSARDHLSRSSGAFNVVMAHADHGADMPAGYAEDGCEGRGAKRVCLYRRPGTCMGSAPRYAINTVLRRIDQ